MKSQEEAKKDYYSHGAARKAKTKQDPCPNKKKREAKRSQKNNCFNANTAQDC